MYLNAFAQSKSPAVGIIVFEEVIKLSNRDSFDEDIGYSRKARRRFRKR